MATENDTTPERCPACAAFQTLQGVAFQTAAALEALAELLEGVSPSFDQDQATVNAEGFAYLLRPIGQRLEAAACEEWKPCHCDEHSSNGA